MGRQTATCAVCGEPHYADNMKQHGHGYICHQCYAVPYRICSRCRSPRAFDRIQGWSHLCNDCMAVAVPIPGASRYGVEPDGSIWRYATGRLMRQNKVGAVCIRTDDGRMVCRSAARLARRAHGRPPVPPVPTISETETE